MRLATKTKTHGHCLARLGFEPGHGGVEVCQKHLTEPESKGRDVSQAPGGVGD